MLRVEDTRSLARTLTMLGSTTSCIFYSVRRWLHCPILQVATHVVQCDAIFETRRHNDDGSAIGLGLALWRQVGFVLRRFLRDKCTGFTDTELGTLGLRSRLVITEAHGRRNGIGLRASDCVRCSW